MTLKEKLVQSKVSKRSSLRRRDKNQHFEPEDLIRGTFNKGTSLGGDVITNIGPSHAQLSSGSKQVQNLDADMRMQSRQSTNRCHTSHRSHIMT
jgi:hypothetical protein